MSVLSPGLMEYSLKKLGYDAQALAALRQDGHLIWRGRNQEAWLLVPAVDGEAIFAVGTLMAIDPSRDGRLLALALHLNLSPAHTLNAGIALDVEQNTLCLRYTHDLTGAGADRLLSALESVQALGEQIRQALAALRSDLSKAMPPVRAPGRCDALLRQTEPPA